MRSTVRCALLGLGLAGCRATARDAAPGTGAAVEAEVTALADGVLDAARARDAGRFAAHFAPGDDVVYVLNTRRLTSQAALRDAFRAMLGRQREFDPRWTDRRVQALAPGAAVFTGVFRTTARDTSGAAWGAEGVVTFAARREPAGWRIVNWHTSERAVTP